ncbi:hypothetical protein DRQ53_12025 [bacterium]|nr:MAG: hypothetical protein DRQ53_12025 [bacterium]
MEQIHPKEYWQTLAAAIGENGDDWVFAPDDCHNPETYAVIRRLNGGPSIGFWFSGGRYEVSGHKWPTTTDPFTLKAEENRPRTYKEYSYNRITFSGDKSASKAAVDVNRRFLPGFLETWQELHEQTLESALYSQARYQLFVDVHEALNVGPIPGPESHSPEESRYFKTAGTSDLSTLKAAGDTVEFKLRLSRETALKVAAIIGAER